MQLILETCFAAMNNKGSEALFQASSTCKLRLVRMLVEGGTSVNVRNERLETPLMLCCQAKTVMNDEKGRVVSYLLGKHARVNLQDIFGRTALIYACMTNSGDEIIKALLDAKSNPWIEDESKNTVFDYVMNAEDLETTRLLINACRESMLANARDNNEVKQLEECLANIQDIRKFSWPLTGPRIRRDHSYLYAAEKEDPSISGAKLLGANLNSDGEAAPPERRRKRSVCHFDPLDIEEILNCTEEAETNSTNTEGQQDDKSESEEKRKTSARSLSEEERFSFQISDAENAAPRDPSSGLEKLLKLQDSFCSSFDSNEFPCSDDSRRNSEDQNHSSSENRQIGDEAHSIPGRKIVDIFDMAEKAMETKSADHIESGYCGKERIEESFSAFVRHEAGEAVDSNKDRDISEESRNRERLFTFRVSTVAVSKSESYTTVSESSVQRHVVINSAINKQFTEATENRSNRIISPVTSQQSSPVMTPLASPQMTRRETHTPNALKQSPRASPVPTSENNRLDGVPIVRRYTLSAMDMGKFQTSGIKTLLVPLKHSTTVETDARRGSAASESSSRGGTGGNFTPPGLRKSKSDLTDRTSMSHSLQGKDFLETGPKSGQSIPGLQPLNDHGKERNDVSEFQLPSISSTKKGRRSPKDLNQPITMINPSVENKYLNTDPRIELSLPWRNNSEKPRFHLPNQDFSLEEQKPSSSPGRTSLPSSPMDPPSSPCDVIALAKAAELSPRGPDNTSGEVLPDLLFNSLTKLPYSEESGSKQGGSPAVTPQNSAHRRLRPGTLLPPLNLSNRRSPTHDLEDGYFSGSPSPADVESPRRKSSNEQQRYSFRPISPRSPIRSPKPFNPHSGKPPQSR